MANMMQVKEAYSQEIDEQLTSLSAKVEQLKAKAKHTKSELSKQYDEQLTALSQKRDEAELRLAELQKSGDDASEELKQGFEKAWTELSTAFEKASKNF